MQGKRRLPLENNIGFDSEFQRSGLAYPLRPNGDVPTRRHELRVLTSRLWNVGEGDGALDVLGEKLITRDNHTSRQVAMNAITSATDEEMDYASNACRNDINK